MSKNIDLINIIDLFQTKKVFAFNIIGKGMHIYTMFDWKSKAGLCHNFFHECISWKLYVEA